MHARGFGDAGGGRRVTPQTPFVLGSTAKSFTALAAMQLVDAGRLQLDAPARRYVPEFRLADQRAADRITVRQVLQQTTGLPQSAGGPVVRSAADGTALEALRELADTRPAAAPRNGVRILQRQLRPGRAHHRASLRPAVRRVRPAPRLRAAGYVANSYVALDAAQRAGLATGHRYWSASPGNTDPRSVRVSISAGYLISSAADMGRYLAMCLDDGVTSSGRRIVSRAGLQTMLAPGRPGRLGAWADHAMRGMRWAGTSAGPGRSRLSCIPGGPPTPAL